METTNVSRRTLRMASRLAPWGICLATFAAGGWGVYRFAPHRALSATAVAAPASSADASSALADKLFGAADVDQVSVPRTAQPAPQLPEVPPTASSANRYNLVAPAADVGDEAEVARGQEPGSVNPLRATSPPPASGGDSRYAPSNTVAPADPTDYRAAASAVDGDRYGDAPYASPAEAFATASGEPAPVEATPEEESSWPPARPLPAQAPPAMPPAMAAAELPAATPSEAPANPFTAATTNSAATPAPAAASLEPDSSAGFAPYRSGDFAAAEPTAAPPTGPPAAPLAAAPTSLAPAPLTPTPGLTAAAGPAPLANGTGRPGEKLLEGVQSPVLTLQKLAPSEIQVGKRCTFAVRVRNTGNRPALDVQVRDETPQGTQLLGTSPRAEVLGAEIVWQLGTLSPGEERVVEMELMPVDEGEVGSVAQVSFGAQASAKARCTRPELALRLAAAPQVMLGEQMIVQVELANPGTGDATNVTLLENVPEGVSHAAGPALEFPVGTLRAGETRRLELVLAAEQAGRVLNVMTARADANLEVQSEVAFDVIAPELQVAIEGPQRRYLERPATYQVKVENPGTAPARDVELVTKLPRGMQFVSANNMGEYDAATHSVYWSLAELPPNERGVVELVAMPLQPGEQRLEAATRAEQGLEDRTETNILVEGIEAIRFEVVDVEDPIETGGETIYDIRIVNQGSKEATNVVVAAQLEAGLRPTSAQGETRHSLQGDRVVFEALPRLAPKAEVAFRIKAQGVTAGDQRIRVQVTTDAFQQPITKEESTRVFSDR